MAAMCLEQLNPIIIHEIESDDELDFEEEEESCSSRSEEDDDYDYEASDEDDPDLVIPNKPRSASSKFESKTALVLTSQEQTESRDSLDGVEKQLSNLDLGETDDKICSSVRTFIEAGEVKKVKVESLKIYLRKFGLRLAGNKDVLIQRIKEHMSISDGDGESKYPLNSFVLNCQGDACTGDVVLFEQKVYDLYSIASRSATGPPCGTRVVVGRIVKESYGMSKQQHTFTVEVLWSKGEKPWPPLHPLLIKGRNLYRLKTMRQRWENEEERAKTLSEKHSRGSLARSERNIRVRKKAVLNRHPMKEINSNRPPPQTQMQQQNNNHNKPTTHNPPPLSKENDSSTFFKPPHTITLQKPREPITLQKPREPTTFQNPREQMMWQRPREVMTWQRPQQVMTLQNPREPMTWQRPQEVMTWQRPHEVMTWQRPCEVMTWQRPHEVMMSQRPREVMTWQGPREVVTWRRGEVEICREYKRGRCSRGSRCWFVHDESLRR